MGKKKGGNRGGGANNNNETSNNNGKENNNQDKNNNDNNSNNNQNNPYFYYYNYNNGEIAKYENKKSESGQKENNNNGEKENKNNNGEKENNNNAAAGGRFMNIVLKMDLHCNGCTKKIRKAILSYPGARIVDFEGENKVTVMADKGVDAVKLRDALEKKLVKKVELVSPQPPKDKKNDNNKQEQKPKEAPVITVTLKIPYHCHGCGEKTYKAVTSHKGVYEVNIDKEKDLVKVTGKIDAKKLVEDLKSKLKKSVEIVPEKKDDKKKEDGDKGGGGGNKKEGGGSDGKKEGEMVASWTDYYLAASVCGHGYGYGYGYGYGNIMGLHPPQLFSDENPNACSLM